MKLYRVFLIKYFMSVEPKISREVMQKLFRSNLPNHPLFQSAQLVVRHIGQYL